MNVIISNEADEMLSSLNIDVIKKIHGVFSTEDIISMFENFFYEKMILDITAIKNYADLKNIQSLSINLDSGKLILLLDGSSVTTSSEYVSGLISMGIYNFTQNRDGILYLLSHPNSYKDVASLQNIDDQSPSMIRTAIRGTKVLGVKNLTEHAGSTSFIFMLKKHLQKNYKVIAIEVDKRDFAFFNDKGMISCTSQDFGKELLRLNSNVDIILVDLNNSGQENACSDIIYLLEPSIIKLNKLIATNRNILSKMEGKKVVLNKSLLTPKDIGEFEMESGIKTFYNIPPINDRIDSIAMDNFLVRLGFLKQREEQQTNSSGDRLFDFFKHKS